MRLSLPVVLLLLLAGAGALRAEHDPACTAPHGVCDLRAAVFAISASDPFASAVRIGPDLLVTNRHVVEDVVTARVFLAEGQSLEAEVIPSDYRRDLVLLRAEGLPEGPIAQVVSAASGVTLYTVAADRASNGVRVYAPGLLRFGPVAGKPLSRLHHTAEASGGNSGGALADAEGRLIGIIASGGSGNQEAIPAADLVRLMARSGPAYRDASLALGRAYRNCRRALGSADLEGLAAACRATGNRQMIGDAARMLGQNRQVEESIVLLTEALEMDPEAVNARLSLLVALHLAQDFEAAVPHHQKILEVLPEARASLGMALLAAKRAEAPDLAERVLALMAEHQPQMLEGARRFYEAE